MADNSGATRRSEQRWLWVAIGVTGALAAGAVVAVFLVPPAVYRPTDQSDARAALQSGMLTAAAALVAVAGGLVALAETRRSNANTHVRELYVEAVKLLNEPDNLGIRLGGIYALERIAVDSPADQRAVVEVLSAFVRTRSTDPALRPPMASPGPVTVGGADIRAAVQVLARLPYRPNVPRADLTGADLTGPASLKYLNLAGADLRDVVLDHADLTAAVLRGANLTDARLDGAQMTHATLDGANLTDARLDGAQMTYATLDGANLTDARLVRANLTDAELSQGQVEGAMGDRSTRLPAGLTRPSSWPPANIL